MTNRERAVKIFEELEQKHINLYHDISKEDFDARLKKFLEVADDLDDVHFDAEMLKLFALFKEAHTIYFTNRSYVENCVSLIGNKYFFFDTEAKVCEEIKEVNGHDVQEVVSKLKKMIPYECDSWLNYQVKICLTGIKHMQMIDCENKENPNQIEYTLKSGKRFIKQHKPIKKITPYSYQLKDNNILYVDYKTCRDMQDYPFVQMVKDIDKDCKTPPQACVVDLRDNRGGNDAIIYPLIKWLKMKNVKTYALINGGTFSSGVWAAIDLKHILGATLVGSEAGQAGHNYGECRNFEVDGKEFCCSVKYFNRTTIDTNQNVKEYPMDKIIDYDGPIKPDIFLEPKIEDVRLGNDGMLRDTLYIIKKDLNQVCGKELT